MNEDTALRNAFPEWEEWAEEGEEHEEGADEFNKWYKDETGYRNAIGVGDLDYPES